MSRFAGYKKYVHSFFLKIKWNLCFSWCHFKKTASVSVLHLDENLHMQSTHRHLQCGKAKSLLLWYFFETVWDINELFNWSSYRYKRLHYFLKIHTDICSIYVPMPNKSWLSEAISEIKLCLISKRLLSWDIWFCYIR